MALVVPTCATVKPAPTPARAAASLVSFVDPLIGTSRRDQKIGAVNSGQTYPAVGEPFSMTHWTPQTQATEDKCVAPYYFQDTRFQGFRGTHWWSGACTQDYGSVTIAATTGPLRVSDHASAFRHETEVLGPDYYAVTLDDFGIRAEVTGATRAGVTRFTFPATAEAYLLVHPNPKAGEGAVEVLPARREVVGSNPVHRLYAGNRKPAGFSGYFVARFDVPLEQFGSWTGNDVHPGVARAAGAPGAYVRLATHAGQVVQVRVGTSFTSIEEARRNLDAEIGVRSFDEVRQHARDAWESALGRVRVRGGTRAQLTKFYTALYHALLLPRTFSDVSGTYPRFAGGGVEQANGWTYYDDFSLWDTFRALHPLLVLLQPERVPGMMQSLVVKAAQGGWLPNFPAWNSYTAAMIGDHGAAVLADAYVKGVRGFDAQAALAAMIKNATEVPPRAEYLDGRGRRALESYRAQGYIPVEQPVTEAFHKAEQVSRTMEYSYDDFAIGALASALGRPDVAATFAARAQNYRNVIDASVGFARGRHTDGSWVTPFDPAAAQPWITEGVPWQYTFFAPHDVQGLISLLGGRPAFVAKLDELFAGKHYWHGNEPSHHIPFLYDHAGAPWKTQERVRQILNDEYGVGPDGLSGNDDTGQMSAWYLFAALGFYPGCPGRPQYELASPLFEEAVLELGGGKRFTIRAPGASAVNAYIQSATLDGTPYDKPWLAHADVARGATLVLTMGPRPNLHWGTSVSAAPPSLSPPSN